MAGFKLACFLTFKRENFRIKTRQLIYTRLMSNVVSSEFTTLKQLGQNSDRKKFFVNPSTRQQTKFG